MNDDESDPVWLGVVICLLLFTLGVLGLLNKF